MTRLSRHQATRGAVYALGAAAGYLPVAMAFGALATKAGISPWITIAMSAWVYAAAAQMIGIQALVAHSGGLFTALSMTLVNLRYLPMSMTARPVFHRFGRADQAVLALTLTDESYALDLARPNETVGFYRGLHALCWVAWVSGTCVGVAAGAVIPTEWTTFALPALFLALAVDVVRDFRSGAQPFVIAAGIVIVGLSRLAGTLSGVLALAALSGLLWAAGRHRALFKPAAQAAPPERPLPAADPAEPVSVPRKGA